VALMREQLRGAAPYISVFGLILLIAAAVVQGMPTVDKNVIMGLAGAGLVLLFAWPVLDWDGFKTTLGGRRARFGGNALLLALAVIGGLVAINFLSTRYYYVKDLTANKQYTLQRQTLQILDGLNANKQAVHLTAVLPLNEPAQTEQDLRRLVERYTQRSPEVTFTVLRPQMDPAATMALTARLKKNTNELPGRGLIAEAGDKNATVFSFDEQGLSEAIIKATRTKVSNVYFTTGHGEPGIQSNATGTGYSAVAQELGREGYKVSTINLVAMTQTLKVGDAVIVAGARQPFQPSETKTLDDYIKKGGAVMLMLDPGVNIGLEPLMLPWAIRPHDDLVLDPAGAQLGAPTLVPVQGDLYQFHTITKDLNNFLSVIPSTRSLGTGTAVSTTMKATPLIKTGLAAWGETDLASLKTTQPTKDAKDNQAPLTLGVAAEGGKGYGRLVAYGSSLFVADGFIKQMGNLANGDLFLNSVNWLTSDPDLISIRPTAPDDRPLSPPKDPGLLDLFLAVLLPLTILGIGVWIWWRRR
jgi:ABC-type uncharacterized transport system involved in gliding motility auxiliary subunit